MTTDRIKIIIRVQNHQPTGSENLLPSFISTTAAPCTTARGYYLRVYNVTHLPYKMATPVNDYYNIAAVIDHASVKFLRNIT